MKIRNCCRRQNTTKLGWSHLGAHAWETTFIQTRSLWASNSNFECLLSIRGHPAPCYWNLTWQQLCRPLSCPFTPRCLPPISCSRQNVTYLICKSIRTFFERDWHTCPSTTRTFLFTEKSKLKELLSKASVATASPHIACVGWQGRSTRRAGFSSKICENELLGSGCK